MIKRIVLLSILGFIIFVIIYCAKFTPPLPNKHGKVDSQLFLGKSENQPLIVAFGGSEGGMGFTGDYTRAFREEILSMGYAFLSIGYFGTENTQSVMDRISLNAIYDTVQNYKNHPLIDGQKIIILGGSRGGELVLNLASRYNDFDAVISIVPSNLNIPYTFNILGIGETSTWTIDGDEIPYIRTTYRTKKILKIEGFYRFLDETLKNKRIVSKAEIQVENITCPLLIVSAKDDTVWPSTLMSNMIIQRLKDNDFGYYYEHIAIDGGHKDIYQNYSMIIDFLNKQIE